MHVQNLVSRTALLLQHPSKPERRGRSRRLCNHHGGGWSVPFLFGGRDDFSGEMTVVHNATVQCCVCCTAQGTCRDSPPVSRALSRPGPRLGGPRW